LSDRNARAAALELYSARLAISMPSASVASSAWALSARSGSYSGKWQNAASVIADTAIANRGRRLRPRPSTIWHQQDAIVALARPLGTLREQWGAQQNRQIVCQRTCGLMFNCPFERGAPLLAGDGRRVENWLSRRDFSGGEDTVFLGVLSLVESLDRFQLRAADRLGGLQKQKNGCEAQICAAARPYIADALLTGVGGRSCQTWKGNQQMKTLVFALAMAASAATLSGCVTTEEMEARVAAKDGADCQDYGAAPGTSGYLQCRMLLRQQHVEQTAIAAAQAQAQFNQGAAMLAAGLSGY
jgi:hypothetical protein